MSNGKPSSQPPSLMLSWDNVFLKQVHISHLMISPGKWESHTDLLKKPQASGQLAFQIFI